MDTATLESLHKPLRDCSMDAHDQSLVRNCVEARNVQSAFSHFVEGFEKKLRTVHSEGIRLTCQFLGRFKGKVVNTKLGRRFLQTNGSILTDHTVIKTVAASPIEGHQ